MVSLWQKILKRGSLLKLGLIGAAFASAGLAHHFAGDSSKMVNPAGAVVAWVFAIALAVLATYRSDRNQEAKQTTPLLPRWEVLALLFLFIFALLVRAIALGSIPPALSGDEAGSGLFSVEIVKGLINNPFTTGWYHFPSLFSMLPALAIALGGQTIAAVRIPSAIAGALTVLGIYGLGRVMFGRSTGWVSAILLAGSSYHIQFSRLGLNNIWDGFFIVLIFMLFWSGWKTGKRGYFVGAGALLGLSQYFYVSAYVVPIIVLVWLFSLVVAERQQLRQRLADLLAMGVLAAVVILPLALHYFNYMNEFWEPLARGSGIPQIISDFQYDPFIGWINLLWNFGNVILAFVTTPLISFYTLQRPLLPAILVPFFILGMGIVVFHLRDTRYRLLFFWGILVIVLNVLSLFPPAAHRYVLGAPFAFLATAVGLMAVVRWVVDRWPRIREIVYGAALLISLVTVGLELQFYFLMRGPVFGFYSYAGDKIDINSVVAMRLAIYLEGFPEGTQVIFFGAPVMWYHGYPQLVYLAPQVQYIDVDEGAAPPELTLSSGHHLLFVFLPNRLADVDRVERQYPGGTARWISSQQGASPLFFVYEITSP